MTSSEGPVSGYDAADRPDDCTQEQDQRFDGTRRATVGLGAYLDRGWHLVPVHSVFNGVCTCGNLRCDAPGKHPMTQHGLKDASADPEVVRAWLLQWPDANWAVRTGAPCGPVIIDVDRHTADGFESLDDFELNQRREPLPATLTATTGGGGRHLYFASADLAKRVGWLPGVDVQARGAYALLPGSLHLSGGRYGWNNWADWSSRPLPEVPEDVQSLLRGRRGSSRLAQGSGGASDLPETHVLKQRGLQAGGRNDGFWLLACRVARVHHPHRDIAMSELRAVWVKTEQPPGRPFKWSEAEGEFERAWAWVEEQIGKERAWEKSLEQRLKRRTR